MDYDSGVDLEELERQWDASREAAEAALNHWNQKCDEAKADELIEAVLVTQREQRDRYKAVREYRQKYGAA
jgi:hypothetical protein